MAGMQSANLVAPNSLIVFYHEKIKCFYTLFEPTYIEVLISLWVFIGIIVMTIITLRKSNAFFMCPVFA